MEAGVTDSTDIVPSVAKKGYSIWSLMVIMTLLAVLLALPKPTRAYGPLLHVFLAASHQIALWGLFGRMIWMLLGKRRSVLIFEAILVVIVWGPLFAIIAEDVISGSRQGVVRGVLKAVGLFDGYGAMYQWIFRTFGYGPI